MNVGTTTNIAFSTITLNEANRRVTSVSGDEIRVGGGIYNIKLMLMMVGLALLLFRARFWQAISTIALIPIESSLQTVSATLQVAQLLLCLPRWAIT